MTQVRDLPDAILVQQLDQQELVPELEAGAPGDGGLLSKESSLNHSLNLSLSLSLYFGLRRAGVESLE